MSKKKKHQKNNLLAYNPLELTANALDWLNKNDSISKLLRKWTILLCLDFTLFTSKDFTNKLELKIGKFAFKLLQNILLSQIESNINNNLSLDNINDVTFLEKPYIQQTIETYNIIPFPSLSDFKILGINAHKKYIQYKYSGRYYYCKISKIPNINQNLVIDFDSDSDFNVVVLVEKRRIHNRHRQFTFWDKDDYTKVLNYLFSTDKRKYDSTLHSEYKQESNTLPLTFSKEESLERKIIAKDSTLHSEYKQENSTLPFTFSKEELLARKIIAKDVSASELVISKGCIKYGDFILKSVRIPNLKNKKILYQIDHKFELVKDYSVKEYSGFLFNPANDLSYLLAEIDRHQKVQIKEKNNEYPLDGEFDLPWRYVTFYDGIMYLNHPNGSQQAHINPFHFRHPDIKKSFRDIMMYIKERSPLLRVESKDGNIIGLLNFEDFRSLIPTFVDYSSIDDNDISYSFRKQFSNSFYVEIFQQNSFVRKSHFLSYLSTLQVKERTIFSMLETVIHSASENQYDEDGYLFTIYQDNDKCVLLYENTSDSSRSSLVFNVITSKYDEAIDVIKRFLSSDIENKRFKLCQKQISFNTPSILRYTRIIHRDYIEWKYAVDRLLRLYSRYRK